MMSNFESMADEIRRSGLFDSQWYSEQFPDVAIAGLDPMTHFLRIGMRLHRDPGPQFDTRYYSENNPDIVTAGFHPLVHYLYFGRAEGRLATPSGEMMENGGEAKADTPDDTGYVLRDGRDAFALRGLEPQATRAVIANARNAGNWQVAVDSMRRLGAEFDLFILGLLEACDLADLPAQVTSITHLGQEDEAGYACGLVRLAASGALDDYGSVLWLSPADAESTPSAMQQDRLTAMRVAFEQDADWACAGVRVEALDFAESASQPMLRAVTTALARIGCRFNGRQVAVAGGWAIWLKPVLLRAIGLGLCVDDRTSAGRGGGVPDRATVLAMLALVGREAGMTCRTVAISAAERQPQPDRSLKTVAFYLPQFHPIPENDRWWGKGFTEWSNVTRARPFFDHHYQPRLPADLGFYDLRLEDTQVAQAALARAFGIHGFCFYYYWFNGKKLLNHPIEQLSRSSRIDTGFCVCWANENWTRIWDGQNRQVLIEQDYSLESNVALIRELIPMMKDRRWIRHQGKPVILVYRISIIPNWMQTARIWRDECRKAGLGEIHLCAVRFGLEKLQGAPEVHGLDSYVMFPPHESAREDIRTEVGNLSPDFCGEIFDYDAVVDSDLRRHADGYEWPVHRGTMLAWDNTPRRMNNATLFHGATPYGFRRWMKGIIEQEAQHNPGDESLVFVNAWNEWAEGSYLEPDQRWGKSYLSAYRSALKGVPGTRAVSVADVRDMMIVDGDAGESDRFSEGN